MFIWKRERVAINMPSGGYVYGLPVQKDIFDVKLTAGKRIPKPKRRINL